MAAINYGFDLDLEQRQRNLPRLIEANFLLHLSSQELETVIATELAANPALELDDRPVCSYCGHTLENGACLTCRIAEAPSPQPTRIDDEVERYEPIIPSRLSDGEDEFDEVLLIAEHLDVLGELRADSRSALPDELHGAVEVIVSAIDDRGFVTATLPEIARMAGLRTSQVERVLKTMQLLAPAGVAARDLRESLLLQLEYLAEEGVAIPPLATYIVEHHLDELGAHRYHQLARQLRTSVEDVASAHEFIKHQLSPHPLQDQHAHSWHVSSPAPYVVPDVLISIDEDDIVVEVVGHRAERLRINDFYESLAQSLRKRGAPDVNGVPLADATAEDKAHIRDSVLTARQFISKLQQRRDTLLKISTCVAEMQADFLREGVRELRPLTRAEVALHVGVHESTVSRATANKFVMLPNRKVVPFSDFFTASLGVKDVIRELIESESAKGSALSDMRIRDLLMERGYRIARRTVAKYRAELRILPSTVR